ncbi:MAG: VOC family protein [Caldilineaceae bacterium]|nr:VOC family protein [Caldilineaceae bacterium]
MKHARVHHVGLWVDDVGAMMMFLVNVMGFRLLTRIPRGIVGAGERIFVQTEDAQLIEILTEPNAQPRPDFAVHPSGHVVGVPHLCFQVTDLLAWREKVEALGYAVSRPMPENGYMASELGALRFIWFEGPSGVGFELFEFEN